MSAYGVTFDTKGVAIEQIDSKSALGGTQGLQTGDLILEVNGVRTSSIDDLRKIIEPLVDGKLRLRIVRAQLETVLTLDVSALTQPQSIERPR